MATSPTAAAAPARVDVIAVLDKFAGSILPMKLWDGANPYCNQPGREGSDYSNDLAALCAARDAVRELIEAAKQLRQCQRDYLTQPKGERDEAKGRLVGIAAERLDAAIAQVSP